MFALAIKIDGDQHEDVKAIRIVHPIGTAHWRSLEEIVDFLRCPRKVILVPRRDGPMATLRIVRSTRPHVRAAVDGEWNDSLLELSRCYPL